MIYFDNAATSFPKPRRVERAVQQAFVRYGANPGRSGHRLAMNTARKVYECREAAADMFGAQVDQVVFTCNCTHALNTVFKGALRTGDHVIISDLEHNSVLRPLHALAERGQITYSIAKTQENPADTVAAFEALIKPNTCMIACTHASNAFGIQMPIDALGQMAKQRGLWFLVDAAQTAGVLALDIEKQNIDFLCMPGHKSLYGPSGTGLLITPHGEKLATLMEGGTGSASADFGMPTDMPDRLECGTVNTAGILGLQAGLAFVREQGIERLHRREMRIASQLFRGLQAIPGVQLYTETFSAEKHLPVLSFNIEGLPSEEVTEHLSRRGFALRGGLHCAPLAHRKMGTLETGTVRASIGAMNTAEQARKLCAAVARIVDKHARPSSRKPSRTHASHA